MKKLFKKLLVILPFILIFFTGTKEAYAAGCRIDPALLNKGQNSSSYNLLISFEQEITANVTIRLGNNIYGSYPLENGKLIDVNLEVNHSSVDENSRDNWQIDVVGMDINCSKPFDFAPLKNLPSCDDFARNCLGGTLPFEGSVLCINALSESMQCCPKEQKRVEQAPTGGIPVSVCISEEEPEPEPEPEPDDDTGGKLPDDISSSGPTKENFDAFNPLKKSTVDEFSGKITPANIIGRTLKFLFPISGMILFIMIVWGGFEMLATSATKKSMDAGRQRITAAVAGFFLLFASYWIMQIIEVIFGISVL